MVGQPLIWNVVVVGAWNLAILTPRGVATRLFQLSHEVPVEVQIQIDQPGPIRVIHSGVAVAPASNQLIVEPQTQSAECLRLSAEIATRAVESLPETPMTAVGVNIRYGFDQTPEELAAMLASPLDDKLSDGEFVVSAKNMKRTLTWKTGVLNLEIQESSDDSCLVTFNFHRQSSKVEDLRDWLGLTEAMIATAKKLLAHPFNLRIEDPNVE